MSTSQQQEQPKPDSDLWVQTELEWVWLLAERQLRLLREDSLRPGPDDPGGAVLTRLISARHARDGLAPTSDAEFAEAIASTRDLLRVLRAETRFGRLTSALELSELEADLLMIAFAPHIDPGLDTLLRDLQGDHARRGVDIALVADLLGVSRSDRLRLLSVLDPSGSLVRFGLLRASQQGSGSALHQPLQPEFDAIALLMKQDGLSSGLERMASVVCGKPTYDELILATSERKRIEEVGRATSRLLKSESPPWIVLWGARGSGKRDIASRIAAGASASLLALDTSAVTGGDGDMALRRAQRDALAIGAVLYIGPIADELLDNRGIALTRRLHGYPGPIVFGVEANESPRFSAPCPIHEIEMRPLDAESRASLWQRAVGVQSADLDLPAMARKFALTPGEIIEVGREARVVDGDHVVASTLRRGIDRLLRNELSNLATRASTLASWNDLVLPDEQLGRARELIDRRRLADTVFHLWKMGERVGYGRGTIALFSGPPGTGKTMLAEVIAGELGLDLYRVDLSQVVSKWVGETEKQLARIFELAERAHAVLLFDEADSLLAKRTKVETSNDRHGNLAVNYLLQRLESYEGVAILTTNRAKSLDDAVNRRLTMHLRLEIPEEDERKKLWRTFVPPSLPTSDDLDLDRLARDHELAGGSIKNIAVRAAFYAASGKGTVDMALMKRALRVEMQDMGRLA